MTRFLWKQTGQHGVSGSLGELSLQCEPLQGLQLQAGALQLSRILQLEIVDAQNLGPQQLVSPNSLPEIVIRQDTVIVHYAPTTKRPVECQARWRVLPEGKIDLEISTLTPGKWDGLAVQTCSQFVCNTPSEIHIDTSVQPGIVFYRPKGEQLTYIEFCHPHDGVSVVKEEQGQMTRVRFRLFGHDLEKGVILRGRLRGMIVPRAVDVAAAHHAYQQFLVAPPNLTL